MTNNALHSIGLDWLHSRLLEDIKNHANMIAESDCMGDLITFMDGIDYPYPADADNQAIRRWFMIAYSEYLKNEFMTMITIEAIQLMKNAIKP